MRVCRPSPELLIEPECDISRRVDWGAVILDKVRLRYAAAGIEAFQERSTATWWGLKPLDEGEGGQNRTTLPKCDERKGDMQTPSVRLKLDVDRG